MTTKKYKYICILAGATLLAACTQKTQFFSWTKPTPTPTPSNKWEPGKPTEKTTPVPSPSRSPSRY